MLNNAKNPPKTVKNKQYKIIRYLEEKQSIYGILFEKYNNPILLVHPSKGDIIEANQSAIDYYGYSREKFLTLKIQDINTLSEEEIKKEMELAMKEKRTHFRFLHRLASGEEREVEVYSVFIELEEQQLLASIVYDASDKLKKKLMFDTLFYDSPYGVAILDRKQKVVNINKNFTTLFQYALEEVKGKVIKQLFSHYTHNHEIEDNLSLVYQGEIVNTEGVRRRRDGKLVEVEILGYPVIHQKEVIGVYVIYVDISHKKAYERQLLLFKRILENTSEGVVITGIDGGIEWINNAFTEITGYALEEVLNKQLNILKSGIHDEDFYEAIWHQLKSTGKWQGEIWNRNKKGDIYSEWLTINTIKNDNGEKAHYVGIFKDLSEKKRLDRRMNDLQQKDALTGLYNRNYFLQKTEMLISDYSEGGEGFSIVLINVDSFKEINNSLGHVIGDELLRLLSKRLKFLTKDKYLLARFGGDVFGVLCKCEGRKGLYHFSKKILKNISKPFVLKNTIIHVRVNIGISTFPEAGGNVEALIRYAEVAVHNAKKQMKDNISFYATEMSKKIEDKFFIANHLIRAIPNNEFTIYYQPIIDIQKSGKIKGLEALLRWENPILGMVSPDKFIPIAENTGQILKIGEWVLNKVCRRIKMWNEKGRYEITVAVNISVKQLEQMEFAKKVTDIMRKNKIHFNQVELEITESVSTGDIPTIIKNLKELKDNGVKISMDDFGTGFSSLGQLDLFELDKLKIDKIFIQELVQDVKRQNLVKSIIAMAKSLQLSVVAEGIETEEQLRYLKELGCELGQGYLFSKPLPIEEIEFLLKKQQQGEGTSEG